MFAPTPPRNAREAEASEDALLTNLFRVWLANRGVWEAIPGAGPTAPVPATAEDVNRYVRAYDSPVRELTRA